MPALFLLLDLLMEDLLPMTCPASLTTVAEQPLAAKISCEACCAATARDWVAGNGLCSWDLLALLVEYSSGITLLQPPSVHAAKAVACCQAVNVLAAAGVATRAAASALPTLASAVSLVAC